MLVLIILWCLAIALWIDVVYEIYSKIRKRQKMLQKAITRGNVMNDVEFRSYWNFLSDEEKDKFLSDAEHKFQKDFTNKFKTFCKSNSLKKIMQIQTDPYSD